MNNERKIVPGGRRKHNSGKNLPAILFSMGVMIASATIGTALGIQHSSSSFNIHQTITNILTPASVDKPAPADSVPPTLLVEGTMAVPVIMYHDVLPAKQVWFDLTTAEFSREMAELSQADAHPITIDQYYNHFRYGKPLPSRPILLTFDDCTLGQYTQALPILEHYHFPAVFFVQTASVGVTTVKLHMNWSQLRAAEATGLITVESHTVTHPEDMTVLSPDRLDEELQESKATLQQHLGHPINFLAYPSGTCDAAVSSAAQKAGYLAAFTMDRGWTVSPAQSYFLPRLIPRRVDEVVAVWEGRMEMAPPTPRLIQVSDTPITMGTFSNCPFPVQWLAGGDLTTEALDHRETVGDMALKNGAQAALNGTFFADARIASNGGAMIGPCLSKLNQTYEKVDAGDNVRIEGRPLLLFSPDQFLILPYTAHLGGSLRVLQQLMPNVQDAFVAGGWIVHYGKVLSPEQMALWSSSDYIDPRHRAFVGIDKDNRYILGATQDSINCQQLGVELVKMGVQEAFLLDSGFSTSLVWQNRILVSGHSQFGVPSRPVPQALFLMGPLASNAPPPPASSIPAAGQGAATLNDALSADSTSGAAHYYDHHHNRRRHVRN